MIETKTIRIPTMPGVFADVRVFLEVRELDHVQHAAADARRRGHEVDVWNFTPPPAHSASQELRPRRYAKWVQDGVTVVVACDVPPIDLEA